MLSYIIVIFRIQRETTISCKAKPHCNHNKNLSDSWLYAYVMIFLRWNKKLFCNLCNCLRLRNAQPKEWYISEKHDSDKNWVLIKNLLWSYTLVEQDFHILGMTYE